MNGIRSNLAIASVVMCVLCAAQTPCAAQSPGVQSTSNVGSVKYLSEQSAGIPLPRNTLVEAGAADASLNDLAAITAERLIAVGDRGAILVSDSGGRNWRLTGSPTTANLYGVHCTEDGQGLAVGGWIGNFTRSSHAVILRTQDAGQTWVPATCDQLPRLKGIVKQGRRWVVYGDYSPHLRSSLFESVDGGISWHAIPSGIGRVTAVAGSASGTIAGVDVLGRSFVSNVPTNAGSKPAQIVTSETPLHCLHFTGQHWLAVGDSGLLISSSDAVEWKNVRVPLSSAASEICRWQSIAQVGDHLWIAGFPGSIILHSQDRGITWAVRKTGQTLPISAIRFVDEDRGWATGPMGLILATRDGGQTWYPQRQHAQRLGVLALSDKSTRCAWLPMVSVAWDEQVAVGSIVCTPDAAISQLDFTPGPSAVLHDTAPRLGLAGHWTWNSSRGSISNRLVWELLCWRPDVLLTSDPADTAAAESLTNQSIAALQLARTANAQASELDLPVWNVSKIVEVSSGQSHFSEQVRRILRAPGLPIRDFLLPLPPEHIDAAGENTLLRTVWSISQANAMNASLLGGVPSATETSRGLQIQSLGNYQLVMGRVHREKSMEQLVRFNDESLENLEQWASSLDFLMGNLPHHEAAPLLYRLVQRLSISPRHWPYQQVALERLTHVSDDAADWAKIELLKQTNSDERAAWQHIWESQQQPSLRLATRFDKKPLPIPNHLAQSPTADSWNATPFQNPIIGDAGPAVAEGDLPNSTAAMPSFVVPASAVSSVVPTAEPASPILNPWFQLLSQFNRSSPFLAGRPDVEMLSYRTKMQLASSDVTRATASSVVSTVEQLNASTHVEKLMQATQLVGWPQVAQQEMLLSVNQIDRLRWKTMAIWADTPPLLDGRFDEPLWHAVLPMHLSSLDEDAGTQSADQPTIRWAYDADYLYIAIECPRDRSLPPEVPVETRGYDADLIGSDHVHLLLDTDRDYCTAIELAVSANGQTYDRCLGHAEYDPKWHVMVSPQRERWTAEIAVELSSLTTRRELAGSAWAASARRLNPHGQSQSWSQLRTHQPMLQAAGLLLFVPEGP